MMPTPARAGRQPCKGRSRSATSGRSPPRFSQSRTAWAESVLWVTIVRGSASGISQQRSLGTDDGGPRPEASIACSSHRPFTLLPPTPACGRAQQEAAPTPRCRLAEIRRVESRRPVRGAEWPRARLRRGRTAWRSPTRGLQTAPRVHAWRPLSSAARPSHLGLVIVDTLSDAFEDLQDAITVTLHREALLLDRQGRNAEGVGETGCRPLSS